MRQIGAENEDPLKRIQKEINEVAKREKELQSMHLTLNTSDDGMSSSHSDDSGLSISSSPVNGAPANEPIKIRKSGNFGPARLNSTPANGNHQSFNPLMRTMSTPHLFPSTPSVRRFTTNPVQKGIMQKFIAARGRLAGTGSNGNQTNTSSPIDINSRPSAFIPFENVSPTQIERDEEGRPIRRGYVPVEEKILKELREMRSREMELKKTRRQSSIRQSQPDFSEMNDEDYESDDEIDQSDYPPPGKLRATKSIGELCDALTSNSSLSPRDTPSPPLERRSRGGLRPALSLAQLCDLDDEKTAPSSIRLIAQWENLIQKKQEVA